MKRQLSVYLRINFIDESFTSSQDKHHILCIRYISKQSENEFDSLSMVLIACCFLVNLTALFTGLIC